MRTQRFMLVAAVATATAVAAVSVAAATDSPSNTGGARTLSSDAVATFAPTADTYVYKDKPTRNFGTSKRLIADSSPERQIIIAFTVGGLAQRVTRAQLRLRTSGDNDGSDLGGTVRSIPGANWSEKSVTWNTRPTAAGAVAGSLGAVTNSTWYTVDVTSAVSGNGTYTFVITTTSTDGAYYDSRESGSHAPRLIVNVRGQTPDPSGTPSGGPTISPTSTATSNPTPTSTASSPVLVGAGDIASCDSSGDEATAKLLKGIDGTIFTAGDNSQDDGTTSDYADCFEPTWGQFRSRIRPAPGNHDYMTESANPYYSHFGSVAGPAGKGYYSYDLGNWHIVALNSNCSKVGGCDAGSKQEQWLRSDLKASSKPCTAAYWHHPLFTSSEHDGETSVRPLFQALYDYKAEIVINGHNHVYERFAPQTPSGVADDTRGIREFDVGTGGTSHYDFNSHVMATSQVRNNDTYGVLKLTLNAGSYDWNFIPVAGKTFTDSGSTACH